MAAKRIVHYRGHLIRLYDKSYSIDGGRVVFIREKPDIDDIRDLIDARYGNMRPDMAVTASRRSIGQRVRDWFELQMGVGGDLHRQVWYAWRDYPDAMRLTIATFFAFGFALAIVSLIVIERMIRG